jgi:APA family basic amino acid/polyamine antiporter
MWVTFASGYQVVYQALVVILAGLILFAFLNARRQRLGEAPEPEDLPDVVVAPDGVPANGNGTGNGHAGGATPVRPDAPTTEVKA